MLKLSKRFLTFTLILMLFVATVSYASASNLDENDALVAPDEDTILEVAISKVLHLPKGTNIPNATFNFIATGISVDDNTDPDIVADMKGLNNLSVTYTFTESDEKGMAGINEIVIETGNIFEGVIFPHAGIYVYEITEEENTNPFIDDEDNHNEWLSYSKAAYTLTVYVADHSDGGTYIYAVGTQIKHNDDGEDAEGKVDPTPGGNNDTYTHSQMIFNNKYVKTNEPEDPDPTKYAALFVKKMVSGTFASKDQYFEFDITLAVPQLGQPIPSHFKAYIVDEDGLVGDSPIEVASNGLTTFSLKHGQRLVFVDTPVGTGYVVTEAGATHYTPSVTVITNGVTPGTTIPGASEQDLTTGNQLVGENDNSTVFTNTRADVTPTGLNLKDIPFIGLIVLGLGALVTYIMLNVRRKANHN